MVWTIPFHPCAFFLTILVLGEFMDSSQSDPYEGMVLMFQVGWLQLLYLPLIALFLMTNACNAWVGVF